MAVTAYQYGSAILKAFNKEIDFDSDTIKVALLANTYTPNQDAHDYFDDVVAHEVSGTGYTAGGATLASKTAAYDSATNKTKFSAATVQWPASTITARYAVIYDATPGSDATRPLIGYVDFGADQSTSNTTFEIVWNANGILEFTTA
jgi:hypothetical protein